MKPVFTPIEHHLVGGLTKREYACILLKVPATGDESLDALIRSAQRSDFAGLAMQGLCTQPSSEFATAEELAFNASTAADALIKELKRGREGAGNE